jgi:hypothetical protein
VALGYTIEGYDRHARGEPAQAATEMMSAGPQDGAGPAGSGIRFLLGSCNHH